jgi:hypothetical protein
MVRSLHPGDPGDHARAVSLAGERAKLVSGGRPRLGRGRCRAAGREAGCRVAFGCLPDVVGGGGEPGGDGADGQAGADERVQVFGPDAVGVGAGPGDAGDPVERGLPGDGLVDAGAGEQGAGLLVQAAGHLLGHREGELGVVAAAALGQPQRLGQVAGVGAGEQLDQAEAGEVLLHRGGWRGRDSGGAPRWRGG